MDFFPDQDEFSQTLTFRLSGDTPSLRSGVLASGAFAPSALGPAALDSPPSLRSVALLPSVVECPHLSPTGKSMVSEGICDLCCCQVTELDARPKFTIGNKRISGVDYASGNVVTVHGVFKTFAEKPNIASIPKSTVAQVCELYDKVAKNTVMRGTQRLGVIAACLNQALIKDKKIWKEKKFLDLFNIRQKDFSKGENLLAAVHTLAVPTLADVIENFCNIIDLMDPRVVKLAVEFGMAFKSTHHTLVRASVSSVGAGLLFAFIELKPEVKKYLPRKKEFTLAAYSNMIGVTKSVIKEIYGKVLEILEEARSKREEEGE